nr:NADP-dependent oxidoreductase [Pseudomonas sp. Z13]
MGWEVAGLIEKVGQGVNEFKKGDRVYAMIGAAGGYAEYPACRPRIWHGSPQASIGLTQRARHWPGIRPGRPWWNMARSNMGKKVLIHGGTGGVGHFAVQFAKVKGAEVYATASTDSLPFLRELGVDRAIDYKTEQFEAICKDFDLVIDLIGGETQARSWQVLGEGGRLVSILTMPDAHHPQAAGKTGTRFTAMPRGEELAEIAGLIEAGNAQVYVAKVFELNEAAQALDFLSREHVHGKVVLRVSH